MNRETMTSRERVIKTLNRQKTDRYPIELGSHFSSGINAVVYSELRKHMNLDEKPTKIISPIWCLAEVDEDVLSKFHCDIKLLHSGWENNQCHKMGQFNYTLEQSIIPQKIDDNHYLLTDGQNEMMFNLSTQETNLVKGYTPYFDGPINLDTLPLLAKRAEKIYKESDYATICMMYYGFFNQDNMDWMCKMITDPEEIIAENEKMCDMAIEHAKQIMSNMGQYVQMICLGGDLGTQRAPIVNPELYKEIIAPTMKRFCDFVHQNSDLKVLYHTCGSIEPFIPTLIESGVDVLNPVQISAENMNPELLKEKYGKDIIFFGGGCDTQTVLPFKNTEEVRENVKYLSNIFKKGGGFIFNQVQDIMGKVPPANIVALFDEAYKNSFFE